MRTGHPIANTWRLRCVTRRARETETTTRVESAERHRVYCTCTTSASAVRCQRSEVLPRRSRPRAETTGRFPFIIF